jgi:hypothetical protein
MHHSPHRVAVGELADLMQELKANPMHSPSVEYGQMIADLQQLHDAFHAAPSGSLVQLRVFSRASRLRHSARAFAELNSLESLDKVMTDSGYEPTLSLTA